MFIFFPKNCIRKDQSERCQAVWKYIVVSSSLKKLWNYFQSYFIYNVFRCCNTLKPKILYHGVIINLSKLLSETVTLFSTLSNEI